MFDGVLNTPPELSVREWTDLRNGLFLKDSRNFNFSPRVLQCEVIIFDRVRFPLCFQILI